ncbi:hypothetical protein Rleg10DRAFT_3577 [Rhizobium leguminosarum bv. trifolii WSM2012]|nr:hypothetical protein Rleg10DRAFT_3577 [Rhizobium leguminosarum bv. trifolii WSM2012]
MLLKDVLGWLSLIGLAVQIEFGEASLAGGCNGISFRRLSGFPRDGSHWLPSQEFQPHLILLEAQL